MDYITQERERFLKEHLESNKEQNKITLFEWIRTNIQEIFKSK